MHEDPAQANVTAKVIFRGVMLLCATRNLCEVGIVPCRGHTPMLTIQTTSPEGTVSDPPRFISSNLFIQVTKPKIEGITRRNVGDNRDFRFVPDLEDDLFHQDKVEVFPERFRAKLAVNAGLLYSRNLRQERFEIVEWSDQNPTGTRRGRFLQIADDAALNIDCKDEPDSGIKIINMADGSTLRDLPMRPGTFYTIDINNECRVPEPGPFETDFRFYYQMIRARNGQRFDILDSNVRDPAPRACETAFLGRTDTLGFPFERAREFGKKQQNVSKTNSK